MIIKNKKKLASTALRSKVLDIIETGISRVLPESIIKSAVSFDPVQRILSVAEDKYDVSGGRIFVIGGGKAAARMAGALESILTPENIVDGAVNCKSCDCRTNKIRLIEAGHPVPDARGLSGVQQMLGFKEYYNIGKNDIVICLISGGGSALMPYPVEGITLEDKQIITQLLLGCGATIHEINAVRKHLSRTKGGGLGRHFLPATVISLILSDVIGNELDIIASGQTCADPSTFQSACDILKKYGLVSKAPESVTGYLTAGCEGKTGETPKSLSNCRNYLLGDNSLALQAMYEKALIMGFNPHIITSEQSGDTTAAASTRAREILEKKYEDYDLLLLGGETTPKLPENAGRGGRNQHYAAVSLQALVRDGAHCGMEWVVAAVGTDGSDFLPDIAGAIVDSSYAVPPDIESYIGGFDSNSLLQRIGNSLIVTGSTGTNVGDIIVYAFSTKYS